MSTEAGHPILDLQNPPAAQGPLWDFDSVRPRILADVVAATGKEFNQAPLDLVMGEALYEGCRRHLYA